MSRKKVARKRESVAPSAPAESIPLSTYLLGALLVLVPLTAGRLEVGSEPVEPSLHGVIIALFTGGSMLSVAVWLTALLMLTATVWEWRYGDQSGDAVPRWARVFTVLLLVWLLASVLTSVYRWGTLVAWSWWVVAFAGAWLMSCQRGRRAVVVLSALALAGSLTAVLAVREYAQNVRDVPNWRVFGPFFNPNFLAGYLCLTMPVTLAVALTAPPSRSGSQGVRWLAGFGAYLQMSAILLTGSRFGVFCAVLALFTLAVWMLFMRLWNRQRAALFALFGVLALATAGLLARPLTQRVAGQPVQAREYSGGFRVWTWRGTLSMARANPVLGTGLGTYEVAYPRYAMVGFTRLAHNSYLQMTAEAGFPALVLLSGVLVTLAWAVLRRERQALSAFDGWDARVLRASLAGAIAAGLARNLIDSDWSLFACLFTFWAVVGVLVGMSYPSPDLSPTRGEGGANPSPGLSPTRGEEVPPSLAGKGGRGIGSSGSSDPSPRALGEGQGVRALHLAHAILLAVALILLTLRAGGALSANGAAWNLSQGIPDDEGYLRALCWEPWNGDHALSLGMLYLGMARAGDRSRVQDAERYLLLSARLMPTSKTWYHLGNLYRDVLGDEGKAVQAYRRALEYDPHALRVMVELGATLERQGNLREAEQVYRRMLDIEGSIYNQIRAVPELPEVDYAFAYAGLARIAQAQNRNSEAKEHCARALQILDEDRLARENNPMAQAMPRTPERERALEALRQECERALQTQR